MQLFYFAPTVTPLTPQPGPAAPKGMNLALYTAREDIFPVYGILQTLSRLLGFIRRYPALRDSSYLKGADGWKL